MTFEEIELRYKVRADLADILARPKWYDVGVEQSVALSYHFNNDPLPILEKFFPNETKEIKKHRALITEKVTKPVVESAVDRVSRIFYDAGDSVVFQNELMYPKASQAIEENKTIRELVLTDGYFHRVLHPNSYIVWLPDAFENTEEARFFMYLAQTQDVCFESKELLVFSGEKNLLLTKNLIASWELDDKQNVIWTLVMQHDMNQIPAVKCGGRSASFRKDGRLVRYFESDLYFALPLLNRAMVAESQFISSNLTVGFPVAIVKAISCPKCLGSKKVIDQKTNLASDCKSCLNDEGIPIGKIVAVSPLQGFVMDMDSKFGNPDSGSQDPIRFVSPDTSILDYMEKIRSTTYKEVKDLLMVTNTADINNSGTAKELDNENRYVQLSPIKDYVFRTVLERSYEIAQGYWFPSNQGEVSVIPPISFDYKTEEKLLKEFTDSLNGLPEPLRYIAFQNYIQIKFPGNSKLLDLFMSVARYAPFILYSQDERLRLNTASDFKREIEKAVLAFSFAYNFYIEQGNEIPDQTAFNAKMDELILFPVQPTITSRITI